MKEFVASTTKEKQSMVLDFFRALYRAIKNRTILFRYLLINLFKQRYISSIKSYNYLKWKNNGLNFFENTTYIHTIPLIKLYKVSEKEKYTLYIIACLTTFTSAFHNTCVENLLKGPEYDILIYFLRQFCVPIYLTMFPCKKQHTEE